MGENTEWKMDVGERKGKIKTDGGKRNTRRMEEQRKGVGFTGLK